MYAVLPAAVCGSHVMTVLARSPSWSAKASKPCGGVMDSRLDTPMPIRPIGAFVRGVTFRPR